MPPAAPPRASAARSTLRCLALRCLALRCLALSRAVSRCLALRLCHVSAPPSLVSCPQAFAARPRAAHNRSLCCPHPPGPTGVLRSLRGVGAGCDHGAMSHHNPNCICRRRAYSHAHRAHSAFVGATRAPSAALPTHTPHGTHTTTLHTPTPPSHSHHTPSSHSHHTPSHMPAGGRDDAALPARRAA